MSTGQVSTLCAGVTTLCVGVATLSASVGTLSAGVGTLCVGVGTLCAGVITLCAGVGVYSIVPSGFTRFTVTYGGASASCSFLYQQQRRSV